MSVAYRENEAAFLGGALSGLMTKTNNVGAVMAVGETLQYRYQFGFTAGVKAVNPECEVQSAFTNVFRRMQPGSLQCGQGCRRRNVLFRRSQRTV